MDPLHRGEWRCIMVSSSDFKLMIRKDKYMKKQVIMRCLFSLLLFCGLFLSGRGLAAAGSISGMVTTEAGSGIEFVMVIAYDTGGSVVASDVTGADGSYSITGFSTGAYKVRFWGSDQGYLNEWYDDKTDFASAETIVVTASQNTPDVNATLAAGGGSISGRVTSPGGAGIMNIQVLVFSGDVRQVSRAWTGANGYYLAEGIPTGSYAVFFRGFSLGYESEWYDDNLNIFDADAVTVIAPQDTPDINAVLAQAGSISGRVTDPEGAGIPDVSVEVYDGSGNFIRDVQTDANGFYTIRSLPHSNDYRIQFVGSGAGYSDEWYDDKADFGSADSVTVTVPQDTPDINAVLQPTLWSDAVDVGGGWYWYDWFGYFSLDSRPWIYHMEHGWMYPFAASTDSIYFWDSSMNAFWWTSQSTYPYLYRFSDGEWLWYLEGSVNPLWFVRLSDGVWEEH